MRHFRSYAEVAQPEGENVLEQVSEQRRRLAERLASVRRVIAVASGKGGVGKSAITANLAALLAGRGLRIGVLDGDLNGPSVARMLAADAESLQVSDQGIRPAIVANGISLVSTELLLHSVDAPLRWKGPAQDSHLWRGTLESGAFREFLSDVAWGDLDVLFIDVPPGTDRIERLLALVPSASILLVTTNSAAARHVVTKSVRLLRDIGVERVALVTNMAYHTCPSCGDTIDLFPRGVADHPDLLDTLPVWGRIPFDPALAETTDGGVPLVLTQPESPAGKALAQLADRLRYEEVR